jgi:hypothetical protein
MKHNDGVADGDFTWPPRDEDLKRCGVIITGCEGAPDAEVRVLVHLHLAEVLPPPDPPAVRRHPIVSTAHVIPTARGPRFRHRHWGVEHPEAAYPFHVETDRPLPEGSSAGEAWRAALALAAGLSLAVLSYAQFRGARGELPVPELRAALVPVVPADTHDLDIDVADAARAVLEDVAGTPAPVETHPPQERSALMEAGPAVAMLASRVADEPSPLDAPAAPTIAAPVDARDIGAPFDAPTPPVEAAVEERIESPEPIAVPAAFVDPAPRDEDHIHAALTRWRAAYSALDASAAREVWPSVDTRALARAFRALKSQELRFDRCRLTVNGGSARAACSGHSIYVPRVGSQSPRATPHEWTFELKKNEQRWTIASARSS